MKKSNIQINGVPEWNNGREANFKEIKAEAFPTVMKLRSKKTESTMHAIQQENKSGKWNHTQIHEEAQKAAGEKWQIIYNCEIITSNIPMEIRK